MEHLWGVLATNSHKFRKKPPKMDKNLYKPDY